MSQQLITFALLIIVLNSINCYTEIDMININKYTYLNLQQEELEDLIATDTNVYNCTSIDKYYYTMAYNGSLIQNYTLKSHNYVYITFDVVFINIEKAYGGITKYAQVDVNGKQTTFSAMVLNDNYKCMKRSSSSSKVDGKTSVSILLAHSGGALDLTFNTNNLGIVARLGISNLNVQAVLCGKNAELNQSSLKCVCKSGYSQKLTSHGGRGHIYYEKECL